MHTRIGENYPLRPEHINISEGLTGAFGGFDRSIEVAAEVVIGFLVKRGTDWGPFRDEDIQEYFLRTHPREKPRSRRFSYKRRLNNGGFLIIKGKEIEVSHELVALCFAMTHFNEAPQERKSST